jgi:branched-chain amino acid transport system substrate-binding protein
MSPKTKFILGAILAIAVLMIVLMFNSEKTLGSVHISANFPLTGEIGIFGENIRNSTLMALDDIADSKNPLPKIIMNWSDNTGSAKNTLTVFQRQFLDPPDVYISGFTPQTLAIKAQIDAKKIPHIAWMFSYNVNDGTQNNFRTWVSYKIEVPVFMKYIKQQLPVRVAIAHVNLSYTAEEFDQYVIPQLKDMGITDIFKVVYDIDTKDYNTIAAKLNQFQPDLIILNGFGFTLTGLVKAMRPLDLIHDGNTIGTYDMIDAQATLTPEELEGIRVVAPKFITHPDLIENWSTRFEKRFNQPPLFHNAYAYDMMFVIHDAAQRLTLPATSQEWIASLSETKMIGVTGNLSFDSDGDLETELDIGVFKNGKLVPDNTPQ